MDVNTRLVIAVISLGVAGTVVAQQPAHNLHAHGSAGHEAMMRQGMGPGRAHGPVAMLTTQDANSGPDMRVTMNLVHANSQISRTVTRLSDGIKTLTESEDPKVAQDIKAHVASMTGRLDTGKEFNIFSTTLPVIFDNAKQIKTSLEFTVKGVAVTQTSADPKVVAALQAHADEVTELVKGGPAAFHRGIDTRMAMGARGPRGVTPSVAPK